MEIIEWTVGLQVCPQSHTKERSSVSCQSWALWQWGSHTEAVRASDGIWPCSCLGTFTVRASRGTRKVGSPHLFLLFPAALQKGFDVFNALDLMENKTFLEKLKFGIPQPAVLPVQLVVPQHGGREGWARVTVTRCW